MPTTNRQKDALASKITLADFGKAMSQIDLSAVPEDRRRAAVFDHMMRIMSDTITDGVKAAEIKRARLNRVLGSPS